MPVTALAAPPLVLVAFVGRTSTLALQDPVASLRRQLRKSEAKLPPGWQITAWYWDIESGGIDLEDRSQGDAHTQLDVGIPRDGGMAELLAEAASPEPRFAAVICEDIERSGRDTFNALKLERQLRDAGIPLFATDEPINVEGATSTTVLVRRVKQGVAEWFRLQIKEKAWAGLREHSLAGWNIGAVPYGYTAEKVPHPVPAKRAEGRTKTRLALDPDRAGVVAQIFTWRVENKQGLPTITARLNTDPGTYPPPGGGCWTQAGVCTLLRNPKYTGHMVWNRTAKNDGHRRPKPPEEWIWTPEPSHPAIVNRETWQAAQAIGAERGNVRDDTGLSAHPQARRTYVLRSRVRCRECRRRMHGITRAAGTYYICPHNPANPHHAATAPGHPRTITVREDHLLTAVSDFMTLYLLGPHRADLLTPHQASAGHGQAGHDQRKANLTSMISAITAAQDGIITELAAPHDPTDPADRQLRNRLRDRFKKLETQRAGHAAELAALDHQDQDADDPSLLDELPTLTGPLDDAQRPALCQACDLQITYNRHGHGITVTATITATTPAAINAILRTSGPRSDSPQSPIGAPI